MIVKQKYAGWIGVKLNGRCANKDMVFTITNGDMDGQLSEYTPTINEIQMLVNGISTQKFPECDDMIGYLNRVGRAMVEGMVKI